MPTWSEREVSGRAGVRRGGFVSFRWKLLFAFTVVFTVAFVAASYAFYLTSTERALERIRLELQHTIEGATGGLDGGSIVRLLRDGEANAAGFSDHPDYLAQLAWFRTVQSLEPRAWPHTYAAGPGPNEVTVLADLWSVRDAQKAFAFREIEVDAGPMLQGLTTLTFRIPRDERCHEARAAAAGSFLGEARGLISYAACIVAERVGYTDAHGSWVSAYAPVLDGGGVRVGGLGIDFEAAYVDEVQDAIIASTSLTFGVTYLVLLLLLLAVSAIVTRPVVRLTEAAKRVGDGDHDLDFSRLARGRWRDEIGVLATVLHEMAGKVKEREQTLQREVQSLKIQVDERQRRAEVQAIVETDFFRELQGKAKTLRSRNARPVDEGG